MALDTIQALSADTPESVASAIRPHDLTPDDGAVMMRAFLLRQAADLLTSQAAEIARLSEERDRARHRTLPEARATQAESALATARADYTAVMAEIGVESIADVPALLSAERAKAQALRDALQRTLSAAKTAEDREVEIGEDLARHFDALISEMVSVAEAALFTDPTEQPAPADRMTATVIPYTDEADQPDHDMDGWSMVLVGVDGGIPDYVFDRIPTPAAQTICDLINLGPSDTLARELAVVKARAAGLLTEGEGMHHE